jgi:hypothetical protein
MRCGQCRGPVYCNRECQRAAWPAHKAACREAQRAEAAAAAVAAAAAAPTPAPAASTAGAAAPPAAVPARALPAGGVDVARGLTTPGGDDEAGSGGDESAPPPTAAADAAPVPPLCPLPPPPPPLAVWMSGLAPTCALVAKFRAAHVVAAARAGLEPAAVAAEAALFARPAPARDVEGGVGEAKASLDDDVAAWFPQPLPVSWGVRLGLSREPAAVVHAAAAAGGALERAAHVALARRGGGAGAAADGGAVIARALEGLRVVAGEPRLRPGVAELLQFVLNSPRRANGYVYCVSEDVVVVTRCGLALDPARAALTRALPRAGGTACAWCGTPAVCAGVALVACAGCGGAPTCGDGCRAGAAAVGAGHAVGCSAVAAGRGGKATGRPGGGAPPAAAAAAAARFKLPCALLDLSVAARGAPGGNAVLVPLTWAVSPAAGGGSV